MTPRRHLLLAALAALAILPWAGARAEAPAAPLTVLAAASLTESLQSVGAAWTAKGNGPVTFSFDATSRLAKQIEGGVPADVFVSADLAWMDHLETRGLLAPGTRTVIAGNALVAVVGRGAAFAPTRASDLAAPAVKRLALAGENVPAGRYARAALVSQGAWDAVRDRVVVGDDVRGTLTWVAAGEADAGVVYATDARIEPRVRVAFTFPSAAHPPIVYPAAALAGSRHGADAARFVAFCRSPEARAIFAAAGFTPPPG